MKFEEMKEEELKETLELVKRVFDEFEAPDYTGEGVTNFYKFIAYDSILEQLKNNFKIFVAKVEDKIIGMVCIRDCSHIAMLFVDKKYHKKGIGTELMNIAKNYCKEKNGDNYKITVNSAPFAIDFYHKIGFKDTGKEQTVDGIRFLPMQISIYKFKEYGDEYFDYLYQTKKECFKWYVEKIYGPWEDEFQVEFFKNFIREKRNYIKIIIYNDRPIGMFTNYINEDGNDFIDLFYIDKEYQGSRIGTQILNEQLLADKKSNVDTVLQVFKENPAKKLYEKVGFEVYDETNTHYKVRQYVQRKFIDIGSTAPGFTPTGDTFCSDYIYLRTGEMYFVAAEALYRAGKENEAKTMLTTIMKTRNPKYETSATSDALLQEIELQKRIEMWGEGRRLFDMKRRNESLDRTHAINHSAIAPKEVPAGSKLFIYQIPDKELNANSEITDKNE